MTINIILSAIFLTITLLFAHKAEKSDFEINSSAVIPIVFALGFVIRIFLGACTVGYETDINLFKAWGDSVVKDGMMNVYHTGLYLDYPPGYLYLLGLAAKIKNILGLDYSGQGYTLLIKLPSIIADIAISWIIYREGKSYVKKATALLASSAFLFCPAVLINSSVWGQADSWCMLMLIISVVVMLKDKADWKNYLIAGIFYGIAIISKPQMLIFAPIYLFYTIFKKEWKGLAIGVGSAVLAALIIAKPYTEGFNFTWLIDRYTSTMNYYDYYTINAYNIWALLGKNWGHLPEAGVLKFILNWVGPFVSTVIAGVIMFGGIKLGKSKAAVMAVGAELIFTVYILSVKMHERYVFPALVFILLLYFATKKRDYLYIFSALSFAHFINVAFVLYLNNSYISPTCWQILLFSLIHVLTWLFFTAEIICEFVFDIDFIPSKDEKKANTSGNAVSGEKISGKHSFTLLNYETAEEKRKLNRTDLIVCLAITCLYGILAFWNLGDNFSANTLWNSHEGDEAVLMAEEEIKDIRILPGIGKREDSNWYMVGLNIEIEYSNDGESWKELTTVEEAAVYEWHEINYEEPFAKYIKIKVLDDKTVINEVGFTGGDGSYTVKAIDVKGNAPELVDEQDAVPLKASYMNGTYFDEIYHARTAYEHILGVEIYENTHPTLGKLIISLGILMFGMNPFGWRFMGTLFGVLMLPIFYHLLKRLFGNTMLSTLGVLAFALDFMHYVQTRIATIDTYAVFFILLMYDAMLVFVQSDIMKTSVKKLCFMLLTSGIFMGMGIAAKWTCVYAAVGLAVMYFVKLFADVPDKSDAKARREYINKALLLCEWCFLFFIFIPFGIYFAAFLPVTLQPQNRYDVFGRFVAYQTNMFNYHSQLVAQHDFASPWYEWPLDIRNIWYCIDFNTAWKGSVSTITCMGNPVLWWGGLAAIISMVPIYIKKRSDFAFTAIVGYCAAYLPWVLVPRLTFVYHYFTAVPFITTAIIAVFAVLRKTDRLGRPLARDGVLSKICISDVILMLFVIMNSIVFIIYYPVLSGKATTIEYVHALEFMPNWYFG